MDQGPSDRPRLPVKSILFVDANDHDTRLKTFVVRPPAGQTWSARSLGTRSAQEGIPVKDLPDETPVFRRSVQLFSSPNQSQKVPFEYLSDQDGLRELECTDDLNKGHAFATVYYEVDDEYVEQYRAQKAKQAKQAASRKRAPSNSVSNSDRGTRRRQPAAQTAAAAAAGGPAAGEPAEEDAAEAEAEEGDGSGSEDGSGDPVPAGKTVPLDETAKKFNNEEALAAVCPRQPNGRFRKKMSFKWKAWDPFLRAVTARLMSRKRFRKADSQQLRRMVSELANQTMRNKADLAMGEEEAEKYTVEHYTTWRNTYGEAFDKNTVPVGDDWFMQDSDDEAPAVMRAAHVRAPPGSVPSSAAAGRVQQGSTPASFVQPHRAGSGLQVTPGSQIMPGSAPTEQYAHPGGLQTAQHGMGQGLHSGRGTHGGRNGGQLQGDGWSHGSGPQAAGGGPASQPRAPPTNPQGLQPAASMLQGTDGLSPQLAALLSSQPGQGGLLGLEQNQAARALLQQLAAALQGAQGQAGQYGTAPQEARGGLLSQAAAGVGSQRARDQQVVNEQNTAGGSLRVLSDAAAAAAAGPGQQPKRWSLLPDETEQDGYEQQQQQQQCQRQASDRAAHGQQPGSFGMLAPPALSAAAAGLLSQGSKQANIKLRDDSDFLCKEPKQRAPKGNKQQVDADSPDDLQLPPGMLGAVTGVGVSNRPPRHRRVPVWLLGSPGVLNAAEEWQYKHQNADSAAAYGDTASEGQQVQDSSQPPAGAQQRQPRSLRTRRRGRQPLEQAASQDASAECMQQQEGCVEGELPAGFQEGEWCEGDEGSTEPSGDFEGERVSGTDDSYADDD